MHAAERPDHRSPSGCIRATSSCSCPRASPSRSRRCATTWSRRSWSMPSSNALGFIQQAVQTGEQQGGLPARQFRLRQEPLHGGAEPAAGRQHAGALDPRAGRRRGAPHAGRRASKFLLVPYHMIGARDMESAILGHYAEYVRKHAPGGAGARLLPGRGPVQGCAASCASAWAMSAFFAQLNEGAEAPAVVAAGASFDSGWDAASFEAAMLEPPNGEERSRLVGDLITQYFSAYRSAGRQRRVVRLARRWPRHHEPPRQGAGLRRGHPVPGRADPLARQPRRRRRISSAARARSWSKLVEATNADRPVPLISFVARQRDLRDLVGENLAGAVQLQFSDVLKHWEARFHKHHPGRPQPAGDRREARAAPGERSRPPDAAGRVRRRAEDAQGRARHAC